MSHIQPKTIQLILGTSLTYLSNYRLFGCFLQQFLADIRQTKEQTPKLFWYSQYASVMFQQLQSEWKFRKLNLTSLIVNNVTLNHSAATSLNYYCVASILN